MTAAPRVQLLEAAAGRHRCFRHHTTWLVSSHKVGEAEALMSVSASFALKGPEFWITELSAFSIQLINQP